MDTFFSDLKPMFFKLFVTVSKYIQGLHILICNCKLFIYIIYMSEIMNIGKVMAETCRLGDWKSLVPGILN